MSRVLLWVFAGILAIVTGATATAQTSADVVRRERAAFEHWLLTSDVSPLKAVAQVPATNEIRLGPADADVPLPDLAEHRIRREGRSFVLESPEGKRRLPRHRPVAIGPFTVTLTDTDIGSILTVYGGASEKQPPGYYPYDSSLVFVGTLEPPETPATIRLLGPEGYVHEAHEAGSLDIPLGGGTRLLVRRLSGSSAEESELEIFFSDQTNGKGSYPAGRFVSLIPLGGARYRLDFNRARNPFCAYSSSFACPIPWPGNALSTAIRAGERYTGGGLELSPAGGRAE